MPKPAPRPQRPVKVLNFEGSLAVVEETRIKATLARRWGWEVLWLSKDEAEFISRHHLAVRRVQETVSQSAMPVWVAAIVRTIGEEYCRRYQSAKGAKRAQKDPQFKAAVEAAYRTGGAEAVGKFLEVL